MALTYHIETSENEVAFPKLEELEEKFKQLKDGDNFIITETGFNYGINFLATLKLWQDNVFSNAQLCYTCFAKNPPNRDKLSKILSRFPQLTLQNSELLNQYFLPLPATHRLHFKPNVLLNLVVGAVSKIKTNSRPTPWFSKYNNSNFSKKVIIIGGGLSGASTAYSLAKRGYCVTLYEKNSALALEASGNEQGILYGSFSGNYTPVLELSFSGYRYSYYLITNLLALGNAYQNCGLIQLAHNERHLKQQELILHSHLPDDFCYKVNQKQMSEIANTRVLCDSGLFFPYGLWVSPQHLVQKMVDYPNIQTQLNQPISDITQDADGMWLIKDTNNKIIDTAFNLVLCNAHAVTKFPALKHLALRTIRGQTSLINTPSPLKTVICGNGYITPNKNNQYYTIGASFKFSKDTGVKIEEHLENINNLQYILPDILNNIDTQKIGGKVGFRTSTTDYLPLVGPIADYAKFNQTYQDLHKDANFWIETPCPYLKGLFINVAHGAKGILTAPICGEIIADYIDNTPIVASESLRQALHPNRFYKKNLSVAENHSTTNLMEQ